MENLNKKAYFSLHHGEPTKHFSLCIALDGHVVHHIPNIRSFTKHLGFNDVPLVPLDKKTARAQSDAVFSNLKGIDNSDDIDLGSNACLQYKIADYLYKNSEEFKNECSDYYANLIGTCNSRQIINSKICGNCVMLDKNNTIVA